MVYDNIQDLPVWNWHKVHEKNDYRYLLRNQKDFKNHKSEDFGFAWLKVYQDYIETFGIDSKYKEYLHNLRKIVVYNAEFILEKNPVKKLWAKKIEKEMQQANKQESMSFEVLVARLSKEMGMRINVKQTTVAEFYGMLKMLENGKKDR